MPSWFALVVLNLAVIAVLAAMGYALKAAGWQFALGCSVGFAFCYVAEGCWRKERKPHFTE